MKRSVRKCKQCGKEFTIFDCWLRRKGANFGSYCSRQCNGKAQAARNNPIKVLVRYECIQCGKEFFRRKGFGGTREYCSNECRWAGHSKKHSGAKHPNWKGGISKRAAASRTVIRKAKRKIKACQRCGSTVGLQGHHIKPHSTHPELRADPSNIEVICEHCHAIAEHPNLAFYRQTTSGHSNYPCLSAMRRRISKGRNPLSRLASVPMRVQVRFWEGEQFMSRVNGLVAAATQP